jgi:hypothetical protein
MTSDINNADETGLLFHLQAKKTLVFKDIFAMVV